MADQNVQQDACAAHSYQMSAQHTHLGTTYFAENSQEVESFRYQGLRAEAPEFVPMGVGNPTEPWVL
jgi:hypothetical protein